MAFSSVAAAASSAEIPRISAIFFATNGFEIVNAIPQLHAGGSFAMTAWTNFKDPVLVETIVADAGIDIGGTLIGMHLRRVAIPVRLSIKKIGEANILCARTRPKYIGGARAVYQEL